MLAMWETADFAVISPFFFPYLLQMKQIGTKRKFNLDLIVQNNVLKDIILNIYSKACDN